MKKHSWEVSYPRGTWPVYNCTDCGKMKTPTRQEMHSDDPPTWFDEECKPVEYTHDDIQWLTGTGRYGQ